MSNNQQTLRIYAGEPLCTIPFLGRACRTCRLRDALLGE